jgi:hypothetical protein
MSNYVGGNYPGYSNSGESVLGCQYTSYDPGFTNRPMKTTAPV